MQTNFHANALAADPQLRASADIVRTCVHCGFCTATCPTYLLLGDELDSPRGRIYQIKDMLEGDKPASDDVVRHVDRCLSCLSCMTTCPSGVNYMHLVDHARAHIEKTYRRGLADRALRAVLASILPYPARFRFALNAARLGKPLSIIARIIPVVGARLNAMLDLAPAFLPAPVLVQPVRPAAGARKHRVALLAGCAQPVLNPGINEATIRLLQRHGVEIVAARGEGCCGALVHHMGIESDAHAFAARNIDAWIAEMDSEGLDAIIITASGCGTTIKDYGYMFRNDPAYADKAARVSALARDVTEFLETLDLSFQPQMRAKVAYHSACSMQHGQQIKDGPKRLLRRAGFKVVDVPEGHICCGSAGVYNILQPEIAGQLRARKTANILRMTPDIIATGNIGCMVQIAKGVSDVKAHVPLVHTVELLDWASGGPKPDALRGLNLHDVTPMSSD